MSMTNTPAPPPGQSDDKDWTWVLDRPCPECGAAVGELSLADVAAANRENAAGWRDVLGRGDAWVRARPAKDVWSPLEYACHVRDVFRLFAVRLDLMLTEDDPMFANWNPNETPRQRATTWRIQQSFRPSSQRRLKTSQWPSSKSPRNRHSGPGGGVMEPSSPCSALPATKFTTRSITCGM